MIENRTLQLTKYYVRQVLSIFVALSSFYILLQLLDNYWVDYVTIFYNTHFHALKFVFELSSKLEIVVANSQYVKFGPS